MHNTVGVIRQRSTGHPSLSIRRKLIIRPISEKHLAKEASDFDKPDSISTWVYF